MMRKEAMDKVSHYYLCDELWWLMDIDFAGATQSLFGDVTLLSAA